MIARSRTRQEAAYDRLRSDILSGRLAAGQKLPFAELCSTYSVSVGVIREALSRLVEQGLVTTEPQQGFAVMHLSTTDLVNLTVARREIETVALRYAMKEGDITWESEVMAAHHRLANTPLADAEHAERLSEEWAESHSIFHETLLHGCKNPRLTAIATQLRASAELYRRWSVPLANGNRDIPQEHQALVKAVLARDENLAVRLLDEHIALTTRILLESNATETPADV